MRLIRELGVVVDAAVRDPACRDDPVLDVLDGAGRRDEQMAPLGRCIAAMVRPAAEYTGVLGAGLDAEAALAAFQRQQAGAVAGGGG